MKATWEKLLDEESEGEDGESNLALMAKVTQTQTAALRGKCYNSKEGTLWHAFLERSPNSGRSGKSVGNKLEKMVSSEEGTGKGTSPDLVSKHKMKTHKN
ncbi:hypothetical protein HAX54_049537 [Datura stramonium]|uniref:Uncharacterized protein n=1 Tax=Datura stramonium TaxID=4076 RepID=A0ABS8WPC5_DATST|nr:hypothetical protein [Datura stramonium]